jgi:hypothetical protein
MLDQMSERSPLDEGALRSMEFERVILSRAPKRLRNRVDQLRVNPSDMTAALRARRDLMTWSQGIRFPRKPAASPPSEHRAVGVEERGESAAA